MGNSKIEFASYVFVHAGADDSLQTKYGSCLDPWALQHRESKPDFQL